MWIPNAGPQKVAANTDADELFYGGAAGGGKTDLVIGLALTQHERSLIIRAEAAQLSGIRDRITEVLGSDDGCNWQDKRWQAPGGRLIEFGGVKDPGDERRYQGRPHDLKAFDEITEIRKEAYTWVKAWNRGGKRNRVVCTGNPPTTAEGEWVIEHWGAWLNPDHVNPAEPGELRWYATIDGQEVEVDGPQEIEREGEIIRPKSRTFISSRVEDNAYLMEQGYKATLQSLPEPLRSKMLSGDFAAGADDDPWQVIPSKWVEDAMDRWQPDGHKAPMTAMGADIARGGKDRTVIARRHGFWFDELMTYPGIATPDGSTAAGVILAARRNGAGVGVDVVGVGASAYDHLTGNEIPVVGIGGGDSCEWMDETKTVAFRNLRSGLWWRMREALNPEKRNDIALPPDNELKRELCAPRWRAQSAPASSPAKVVAEVESKYGAAGWNIIKRLGKSPDKADAVILSMHPGIKSASSFKKSAPLVMPKMGVA